MSLEAFTTSGTWECPAGVTAIQILCIGGGGAGGSVNPSSGSGGGGAGGSYSFSEFHVTPGEVYTVTVGSGGAGGGDKDGGDSEFSLGAEVLILARGGNGGSDCNVVFSHALGGAGSSVGNIGDVIYRGGNGGVGGDSVPESFPMIYAYSGAGGGAGGDSGFGGNGGATIVYVGGVGGGGSAGAGADSIKLYSSSGVGTAGLDGNNYGGGGSGAIRYRDPSGEIELGGDGADGYIVIQYFAETEVGLSASISSDSELGVSLSKSKALNISSVIESNGELGGVELSVNVIPANSDKARIANIKITKGNEIMNWWKLNYFKPN